MAYRIVGFEVEPQSLAEKSMTVVTKEGGVKECALVNQDDTKMLAIKRGSMLSFSSNTHVFLLSTLPPILLYLLPFLFHDMSCYDTSIVRQAL